jgi:predicted dehydrogenase
VDVGITKIELPWKIFYEKELDVRFSRSYGPGRYDPGYEWGGHDYPIGYVRWTEQRNFDACLHLMAAGQLNLDGLTTRRVPFVEAKSVYEDLLQGASNDVGVVLEYAHTEKNESAPRTFQAKSISPAKMERLSSPASWLDVIGAGNFARTMLLPHLKDKIAFGTVVNQTALSAKHVKTKFGFQHAATDDSDIFKDSENAAVLIATRHHLHAPLIQQALAKNRQIFVEKPLCLTRGELAQIDEAIAKNKSTIQVGFNRRFAPAAVQLKKVLLDSPGPKSATFRVNAGKLDPHHWYANYNESGGRILGEACHFFDFFCFLFDSKPVRVFAQTVWPATGRLPFPDSISAQMEFADGSSGQLIYSAEGDTSFPKETFALFGSGLVAEITNFQELVIHRGRKRIANSFSSKGHAEQMAAWLNFLRGETEHPLPYGQSRTSMLLTFAALESIQQARSVDLNFA